MLNRGFKGLFRRRHRWIGGALAAGVPYGVFLLVSYSADLPDHTTLQGYYPALSSRVFLRDGTRLTEYAAEKRYYVPFPRIPKKVVHAFVSAEDKNFFQHGGVDFFGILRAVLHNIRNIGAQRRPHGGSTITQQLARMMLIKHNRLSLKRKVQEALLAMRIERVFSKEQILEIYLNHIYLGLDSYGVAAAAQRYFRKTLDELTLSECAFLAAMPKGPAYYHPVRYPERVHERKNWVLYRQWQDGVISKEEYNEASAHRVVVCKRYPFVGGEYFREELRKEMIRRIPYDELSKNGVTIMSTLDKQIQKYAEEALRAGIERLDRAGGWRGALGSCDVSCVCSSDGNVDDKTRYAAVIAELRKYQADRSDAKVAVILGFDGGCEVLCVDGDRGYLRRDDVIWGQQSSCALEVGDVVFVRPFHMANVLYNVYSLYQEPQMQGAIVVLNVHNGRVLAMHGGYSFRSSEFNRVTQAYRQPGSCFKPFVYLAALESGIAPNQVICGSEVHIRDGDEFWIPKNYGFSQISQATLRYGLERSVNTITARVAQMIGMKKVAKISHDFGIYENMPLYISYALGSGGTTLMKMTAAYAMIANGGYYIEPVMFDYVQDRYGNTLFCANQNVFIDESGAFPSVVHKRRRIVSAESVYQLFSIMRGTIERSVSARELREIPLVIAGKTGTSNLSKDAWFIGFTPNIAVGVFVGYDDHTRSIGEYAIGATIALPIFIDFIKKYSHLETPVPFPMPDGIVMQRVDLVTGEDSEAEDAIMEALKLHQATSQTSLSIKGRKTLGQKLIY